MNSTSSPDPNSEQTEAGSPSPLSETEDMREETEWHSPFETHLPDTIQEATHVFGEQEPSLPDQMVEEFGERGYSDTCAIRCQEVILHQYGIDVDEDTLVRQAIVEHLYYPGQATLPEDVGKLLEDYGIPVNLYQHATIFNLTVELAQGHMVMIGVSVAELQHPLLVNLADVLHVGTADHVVIVSGIDTHDPEHVQVIVSDPSSGEVAARYPLESFVNAWSSSNFFVVATEEPLPQALHLPEMEHFDYDSGHIEEIAGMPYDEFLHYSDSPEGAAHVLEEYIESHTDHSDSVQLNPDESISGTHTGISEANASLPGGLEHDGEHNSDDAVASIQDEPGHGLEHNLDDHESGDNVDDSMDAANADDIGF